MNLKLTFHIISQLKNKLEGGDKMALVKYATDCPYCGGRGIKIFLQKNWKGEIVDQFTDYCPHCGGTGEEVEICEDYELDEFADIIEIIEEDENE